MGGVRSLTSSLDIRTIQCIYKSHPWGVALDVLNRLHVTFPLENGENLLIILDPFGEREAIQHAIGVPEVDDEGCTADGPMTCASLLGARGIDTLGTGSFITFGDRVKYIQDFTSEDRGLPKWIKVLRENIQEPLGVIDPSMSHFSRRARFI